MNTVQPDQPFVSILMNCYNGEKYLREALDSVIAQTYSNWELIFWDNCSTDHSAEIFNSYNDQRFRYILAPDHTDLGGARARAWHHLAGDLVAILDADDVWMPTKLDKQIPLFQDPDVGIVISDTLFFSEKKEKVLYNGQFPASGWVFGLLLKKYFVSLETVVLRKSAVMALDQAFDPGFSHIADFDLIVRTSRIAKLAIYPEVLAKWRVHKGSGTWQEHEKFLAEEEGWITKMEGYQALTEKERCELSIFKQKHITRRCIEMLQHDDRKKAARILKGQSWRDKRVPILRALCWIPGSGRLLRTVVSARRRAWF